VRDWILHVGDWRDHRPITVDHLITDPPYSEHVHSTGVGTSATGTNSREIQFDPLAQDQLRDLVATSTQVRRWCLAFCALEQAGDYARAVRSTEGLDWVRTGIWHRTQAAPQLSGDRPAQAAEAIAIWHPRGRKRWHGGGSHAHWSCGPDREVDRDEHQTPKPVDLIARLLLLFTDPGDLIWDPYAGSGAIGVACLLTGRRYIGCEIDPDHAVYARRRLEAAASGERSLADYELGQRRLV
jgi:site-specific DNA-methyltransferase (adenine-specific)